MSVGLLVVRLKYGLYVGHLSKWFVFVPSFMFLVVYLWLHCRLLGLLITVSGLAKLAILTTKLHTKHQCSNIVKTVLRSTEPPILPNPCYKLPFFLSKCCSVEFAVSLCGWAGILFCKLWLVCRLVGLANVYDCKGGSLI